ncbi:hypothetical protein ACRRUX_08140 [Shewanella sp. GXUN23E]
MTPFEITRLHTHKGIFRCSGSWTQANTTDRATLNHITRLEILGTDGWLPLVIEASLIQALTPELVAHLQGKQ